MQFIIKYDIFFFFFTQSKLLFLITRISNMIIKYELMVVNLTNLFIFFLSFSYEKKKKCSRRNLKNKKTKITTSRT